MRIIGEGRLKETSKTRERKRVRKNKPAKCPRNESLVCEVCVEGEREAIHFLPYPDLPKLKISITGIRCYSVSSLPETSRQLLFIQANVQAF